MLVSGVAFALLLVVLLKATVDNKLATYPGRVAMLSLFLLAFAALGTASAVMYRRLARARGFRAGSAGD